MSLWADVSDCIFNFFECVWRLTLFRFDGFVVVGNGIC